MPISWRSVIMEITSIILMARAVRFTGNLMLLWFSDEWQKRKVFKKSIMFFFLVRKHQYTKWRFVGWLVGLWDGTHCWFFRFFLKSHYFMYDISEIHFWFFRTKFLEYYKLYFCRENSHCSSNSCQSITMHTSPPSAHQLFINPFEKVWFQARITRALLLVDQPAGDNPF